MFGKGLGKSKSVIDYEGPQDVLIWKHPVEDFNIKMHLIVHESQQAVFFKNGQAEGPLVSGEHPLDPGVNSFLQRLFGGNGRTETFRSEVYYINEAVSRGIPWGTDSPIDMLDVDYGVPIRVSAFGDFSLRVRDGKKLLLKLVGTVSRYTQEEITTYFASMIAMYVRDSIANLMERNHINGMRVNTQLVAISLAIREKLAAEFLDYGMELMDFNVSNVTVRGLEAIGNTVHDITLKTLAKRGEAGLEQIENTSRAEAMKILGQAENDQILNRAMAEAQAYQIKGNAEAQVSRTKGLTEAEVLRAKGLAEAEIDREKGITENQRLDHQVDMIRVANPVPDITILPGGYTVPSYSPVPPVQGNAAPPAGGDRLSELDRRLKTLNSWYKEGLISAEDFEKRKAEILSQI